MQLPGSHSLYNSTAQRQENVSHPCNFRWSRITLKKQRTQRYHNILILYFIEPRAPKLLSFQHVINMKISNEIVYIVFILHV